LKAIEYLREYNGKSAEKNSLGYLMRALWTGGKIPGEKQEEFQRTAGAADYFEKNLQNAPKFTNSLKAIEYLREHNGKSAEKNSLGYLMLALWTGKRIPKDKLMNWQMDAGAADYFEKNLQNAPEFESSLEAIDWIREYKQQNSDASSLGYLMLALWTGKRIPKDKLMTWGMDAGAADYALKFKEKVSYAIIHALIESSDNPKVNYWKNMLDETQFPNQKDQTKHVSKGYAKRIAKMALGIYGDEICKELEKYGYDTRILLLGEDYPSIKRYFAGNKYNVETAPTGKNAGTKLKKRRRKRQKKLKTGEDADRQLAGINKTGQDMLEKIIGPLGQSGADHNMLLKMAGLLEKMPEKAVLLQNMKGGAKYKYEAMKELVNALDKYGDSPARDVAETCLLNVADDMPGGAAHAIWRKAEIWQMEEITDAVKKAGDEKAFRGLMYDIDLAVNGAIIDGKSELAGAWAKEAVRIWLEQNTLDGGKGLGGF
ncbi:MAG TPA: hypothetical protein PLO51_04680, partial [Candidatus Micrarchaeota archaeon]|nr:hypothetical protein [Candidatus Micrarchaeota archaeon]